MTKCDFHIFRRFRASWLRKNCVPWDLEKMWMGHTHKDLTDQYAEQLREDVKYRLKWCEKIRLGFVLPTNVSQLSQPRHAAVASGKQHEVAEFAGDKMVDPGRRFSNLGCSRTARSVSAVALRFAIPTV